MKNKKGKKKYVPYQKQFEQWLHTARFEHFDSFDFLGDKEGDHIIYLTLKTQLGRIYLDERKHKHIIDKIMNRRFKWRIQIIIRCCAEDGDVYIEERELIIDEPTRLNDLEKIAEHYRDDARASVNSRHITKDGWIAEVIQ